MIKIEDGCPVWKNPKNREAFEAIVADLLIDPDVQALKNIPRHGKHGNCLNHSVYVAYISFLVCRRLGLDYVAAARGGLLHDFVVFDEVEDLVPETRRERAKLLLNHPHDALRDAGERYELSAVEQDIIVKHMWPLTRRLPRHRESFVVSTADKLCAVLEVSRLHKALKMRKNLVDSLAV